jgi:hypothetical protein
MGVTRIGEERRGEGEEKERRRRGEEEEEEGKRLTGGMFICGPEDGPRALERNGWRSLV